MLRGLYDWTLSLAGHRHAIWAMAGVAFVESSVFPIPPDVLIIPMVLAAPTKAWRIALAATIGSVLGGLFGYAIGAFLFEAIGQPILGFYGYEARFAEFQERYNEWGAWIVAGAGFTPFPYKVITIASGATSLDIWVFILASTISRGARFFIVAALLWRYGAPIREFIERYLPQLTFLFFALLLGGFLAVKYLF